MINVIPLYTSPLSRPLVRRIAVGVAVIALCVAAGVALAGESAVSKRLAGNDGSMPESPPAVLISVDMPTSAAQMVSQSV